MNLVMTFIAMLIMEKAGRRPLIMTTWIGMCSGFFAIFVAGTLGEDYAVAPALMANLQVRVCGSMQTGSFGAPQLWRPPLLETPTFGDRHFWRPQLLETARFEHRKI